MNGGIRFSQTKATPAKKKRDSFKVQEKETLQGINPPITAKATKGSC